MIQSLFINSVIAIILAFKLFPPATFDEKKQDGGGETLFSTQVVKFRESHNERVVNFVVTLGVYCVEGRLLSDDSVKPFFVDSPCARTFFFQLVCCILNNWDIFGFSNELHPSTKSQC